MSINYSYRDCISQDLDELFDSPEQMSMLIDYMEHCGIREITSSDGPELLRRIQVMNWMFGPGLYLDDQGTRERWEKMLERVDGFRTGTPRLYKDEFLAKWRKRLKEECDRYREMNRDE